MVVITTNYNLNSLIESTHYSLWTTTYGLKLVELVGGVVHRPLLTPEGDVPVLKMVI